jgi:hypothetical protein
MTRLRKFRSFFLTIEVSRGEPLALLFFLTLKRAVPVIGGSPFFTACGAGPAGIYGYAVIISKSTSGGEK